MRSDWKEVTLGDLCHIKYGKDHKSLADGAVPVYGSGGIMRYVNTSIHDKLSVLIPRKGTLSNLFLAQPPFWTVDTIFWTDIDTEKTDAKFLFYNLHTKNLAELNVGTAVPSLTTSLLNDVEINLPPLAEQKRIASILSSLDDKIENNNAINKNLEEQAQAIYKSWFVDFEPFKNGEFEDSELGKIPKGWRVGKLGEVAVINKSLYAPKEQWDYVNYLDTSSITKGIISEIQYLDCAIDKIPSRAKRKVEKNDIVFSTVRPNQMHYGVLGSIKENMLVSTGFTVISSTENISYQHIYIYLTQVGVIEKLQQIAEQSTSTFPAIRPQDISSLKIIVAPVSLEKSFDNLTSPIFEEIQNLQQENQKLSQLRDSLLPKLMSGAVRVPVEVE